MLDEFIIRSGKVLLFAGGLLFYKKVFAKNKPRANYKGRKKYIYCCTKFICLEIV
jgi:hypothetical protein